MIYFCSNKNWCKAEWDNELFDVNDNILIIFPVQMKQRLCSFVCSSYLNNSLTFPSICFSFFHLFCFIPVLLHEKRFSQFVEPFKDKRVFKIGYFFFCLLFEDSFWYGAVLFAKSLGLKCHSPTFFTLWYEGLNITPSTGAAYHPKTSPEIWKKDEKCFTRHGLMRYK